jgi:hypothetical protein
MDAMCFVFNRDTISQAGLRRFDLLPPLLEPMTLGLSFFRELPFKNLRM